MPMRPASKHRADSDAAAFATHLVAQYGLDDIAWSSTGTRSALAVAAVRYDLPHLFVLPPLPREEAFVIGVELSPGGSRRSAQGGAQSHVGPLPPGATYIVDLADPPIAYVCSPFHSVLFHLQRAVIDEFAAETGLAAPAGLRCPVGVDDPVLAALARAMLPSLMRPAEASALFLDHAALALYAHVAHRYGEVPAPAVPRRGGGLAPWQERRAKDLLLDRLARNISLADVAAECRLSRSHFGKAFRQTTGETPHAWLTRQRLEAAQRMLLESSASLAEIALACGFADQSHLTRLFGAHLGQTPAHWRRTRMN